MKTRSREMKEGRRGKGMMSSGWVGDDEIKRDEGKEEEISFHFQGEDDERRRAVVAKPGER